jgi:hypothetical protein
MEAQDPQDVQDELAIESSPPAGPPTLDPGDGNFKSRKLVFAAGTSGLIFLGGIIGGAWTAFANVYSTMVMGLLGCLATYIGSNVSSRYITGKHLAAMNNPTATPTPTKK